MSNIVQAFDAGQAGDTFFLVMEFIPGTDLARLIQEHGRQPYARACRYIRQAAEALQYAHEQGTVHRDIKPHNLMLTPDGEVKVLDFGLARFVLEEPLAGTSHLTDDRLFMGTADYIAPEQARNAHQADIRADIYSLGCTLYHLLTGQVPFPGGTPVDKVVRHTNEQPTALSSQPGDVPAALEAVVNKMMAKEPGQRYQTPGEVAEALAPFTGEVAPPPRPPVLELLGIPEPVLLPSEEVPEALPPSSREEVIQELPHIPACPVLSTPPPIVSEAVALPDSVEVTPPPGETWRRWRIAIAAGFLFIAVGLGLAGGVVYRIQTDKGELVIETVDDHVEVVVKRGGKIVTIYDPKTKQKLILRSGTYELELKGKPPGLKLDPERVTLKRGDKKIATIVRHVAGGGKGDNPAHGEVEPVPPGKATMIQRFDLGGPSAFRDISPNGRLLLTATQKEYRLWDIQTGRELHRFPNYDNTGKAVFSPNGKLIASCNESWPDSTVRILDVDSGKEVCRFRQQILYRGH